MAEHLTNQLESGGSIPTSPLQLSYPNFAVHSLDKREAQEVIATHHYLHRKAACTFSFGLYQGNRLLGVIMFGSPVSSTLCRGICGELEARNVIELTRLWVTDLAPKNCESFLIGYSLPQVNKDIVVSFADPSIGHIGTVYQATNWIYTGLGPARSKWIDVTKPERHFHRGGTAKRTYSELRQDPNLKYVPAVRKHRYIWFCRKRRKELLAKLRYPILPYPKE